MTLDRLQFLPAILLSAKAVRPSRGGGRKRKMARNLPNILLIYPKQTVAKDCSQQRAIVGQRRGTISPRRARQRESQNRANGLKRLTGTQSSAPRWRGSLKKYEPSCRPLSVEDSYPSIEPWKSELRPERGIFAPEILPPAPTLPLYGRTTQFDTFRRDRRCP